ncbi:unnamed protein product [Rotaria sordida]|uniref:Mitochondrial import inner membrane translocase subunit Tim21 n=1 Tax=Rotaria sordida TaxID=392033 RepID=A0A818XLZ7_9BILA|nr:unnamed protein product [Rotaria sordida]CAF3741544.1 unnamed protein product [Rotaria sordida]
MSSISGWTKRTLFNIRFATTAKIWIIVLGSVGGVVLIAVVIIVWCICRKCKQRSILSENKRQNDNDQRMEERRTAAEARSAERSQAADVLRMKYGRLIIKQYHNQCRSSLFRTIVFINRRQLATGQEKKTSKSQKNQTLVQSTTDNQIEVATFKEKAQQAAKDTGYSLIVIAGIATLGGLCYLVLHELYSRETPNGIYKEASKMCLANTEVQDALGTPILVHTTPQIGSMRINNVRAKIFNEKGHQSMALTFYLTGKERSGVVGVKVEKNISNKFVYEYILVQLDRPWRGRNIIQVHQNLDASKTTPQTIDF